MSDKTNSTYDQTHAELHGEIFGTRRVLFDFTTEEYWDCECDDDYIRPASQDRCPKCGAEHDERPDSHTVEVLAARLPLNLSIQVF